MVHFTSNIKITQLLFFNYSKKINLGQWVNCPILWLMVHYWLKLKIYNHLFFFSLFGSLGHFGTGGPSVPINLTTYLAFNNKFHTIKFFWPTRDTGTGVPFMGHCPKITYESPQDVWPDTDQRFQSKNILELQQSAYRHRGTTSRHCIKISEPVGPIHWT